MYIARPLTSTPDIQDRLRQAALDLFSQRGYQSTSLRDLATHVGVHAGSLYNHIENKQSLLFDLMEEALDELIADTQSNIRRGQSPEERLRLFVQAFVRFDSRGRKRLTLLHRESGNLSNEQRSRIECLAQEYQKCLATLMRNRLGRRTIAPRRLQVLTQAIVGMLQSLPFWGLDEADNCSEELVDQLTSMVWGATDAQVRPARSYCSEASPPTHSVESLK